MQVSLPSNRYSNGQQITAFYDQALERIKSVPGVGSAALGTSLPMANDNSSAAFFVEGLQVPPGESAPHGDYHVVSPGYVETMEIPLLAGRSFTQQDGRDSLPVAMVDGLLAQRYWANENPIGKRFAIPFESRGDTLKWRTIVGVVGHVKQYGLDGKMKDQYYLPEAQNPQQSMYLVVRSSSDPKNLASLVREAIRSVDPDQPIFRVTTMDQLVSNSMAQKRLAMMLLTIFAGIALVLSAVGIYGVISYSVAQRTHEIGIRMALGAQPGDMLGMVVRQAMTMTLIGVGIGLAGAYVATRVLSSLLFGIGAHDPVTFGAVAIVLAAIALLASIVPARRATKVDPLVALRHE
jgi:predicted permease